MPFILPPLIILVIILVLFIINNVKIKKSLRIFFPFMSEKYDFFRKKLWHKLLKVVYLLLILKVILFSFWAINEYRNHLKVVAYKYSANNTQPRYTYKTYVSNWAYSALIVLMLNYVIQLIYFKLVIYLIYRNKFSKSNSKN